MPQLGPLEIIAVAVIALVVFGPHRLPEIARTMGRVISEFKRQANELTSEFKTGLDLGIDDDDDDDDIPEAATFGGLYGNDDDAEDPSEPPLTAGVEPRPEDGASNGAPAPEARVEADTEHTAEVATGDGDQAEREPGE